MCDLRIRVPSCAPGRRRPNAFRRFRRIERGERLGELPELRRRDRRLRRRGSASKLRHAPHRTGSLPGGRDPESCCQPSRRTDLTPTLLLSNFLQFFEQRTLRPLLRALLCGWGCLRSTEEIFCPLRNGQQSSRCRPSPGRYVRAPQGERRDLVRFCAAASKSSVKPRTDACLTLTARHLRCPSQCRLRVVRRCPRCRSARQSSRATSRSGAHPHQDLPSLDHAKIIESASRDTAAHTCSRYSRKLTTSPFARSTRE